jgi:hypothetical protein
MSMIDLPAEKEKLWHSAKADLQSLVPWFRNSDLLLCPACCRPVTYDEMSIEHVLPKQALKKDPVDARTAITQNERSGLTLLCRRQLLYKGKIVSAAGCNSWKGKHFDGFLRDLLTTDLGAAKLTTGHQVAAFSAGYLALFRKFGYQISLSSAGILMRQQFFHPHDFIRAMPLRYQLILGGRGPDQFTDDDKAYWSEPFRISVQSDGATIAIRHMAFLLPLSHDPSKPFARELPYAPSKYKLRLDLRTAFD